MGQPRSTDYDLDGPGGYPATAETTAKLEASSLYAEAGEQLDKALATLDHKLERLYVRLAPVLTPYDRGDQLATASDADRQSDGEIVDRLHATARRAWVAVDILDAIHRRLVLPGD